MLMKRSVPLLLLVLCLSTVHAAYDRIIGPGEYIGALDWHEGLLLVDGGGADILEIRNLGHLIILSTSIPLGNESGVQSVRLTDNSHLDYYGGETFSLTLGENATAILKGGSINFIRSYQNVFDTIVGIDEQGNWIFNTHIEMVVKTYNYDDATNMLTGTWANNDDFAIKLLNADDYDPVFDNIKFTVVPEPATLLLLSLGGLLLRRRKR